MARRKVGQKPGLQTARKFAHIQKFPADLLPSELIHMVYRCLAPKDAAAFRWSGRTVAEVGLQYLVPTVYLRLKEESYDRLLAISEHPVVSKYVVELEYDTEGLLPIHREEFDQMLISAKTIPQRHDFLNRPDYTASARVWRAYERQDVRNVPLLTKKEVTRRLNQAWSIYDEYQTSQRKVHQARFFRRKIADAMKRFQNLKIISTPADSVYERYVAEIKDLLPTYFVANWSAYGIPPRVGATSSVLLAAESVGLALGTFSCQRFKWQIFSQSESNLAALKRSILHLKKLDIAFADPLLQNNMREEVDFIDAKYLRKGRVADFITSTPNLESVRISFESWPRFMAFPTIFQTFGNFSWSSLKTVGLESLSSDGHDLVDFCKRHAHTLKDLSLTNVQLNESCSWDVIFHRIRRVFRLGEQLDTCKLRGRFMSYEGIRYEMELEGSKETAISGYILSTEFGDITLDEYYEVMGLY